MIQSYEEIFNEYSKYNKRATRIAQGLEAGIGIGQYFVGEGIKKKLSYTPPAKVQPSLVDLSTANIYDPAIRNLDRAFISSVSAAREQGRAPDPSLFSAYGDKIEQISRLQSEEYRKTKNAEELQNVQAMNKAKQLNLGVDAKTAEMNLNISAMKGAQDAKTFASISQGIANIGNIGARSVANELSAQLGIKHLSDAETAAAKNKEIKEEQARRAKIEGIGISRMGSRLDLKRGTDITQELDSNLAGVLPGSIPKAGEYFKIAETPSYALRGKSYDPLDFTPPAEEGPNIFEQAGTSLFGPQVRRPKRALTEIEKATLGLYTNSIY